VTLRAVYVNIPFERRHLPHRLHERPVVRHVPVHGKTTEITHDGEGLFAGLPSPLTVGRYHSLVVDPDLPACLRITASGGGVIMAVEHRDLPAYGVQFHPESVLTPEGKRLLANFLDAEPDPH